MGVVLRNVSVYSGKFETPLAEIDSIGNISLSLFAVSYTHLKGTQMKEIDRYTMEEIGIPSMVLMERAAWAFVEDVYKRQLQNLLGGDV